MIRGVALRQARSRRRDLALVHSVVSAVSISLGVIDAPSRAHRWRNGASEMPAIGASARPLGNATLPMRSPAARVTGAAPVPPPGRCPAAGARSARLDAARQTHPVPCPITLSLRPSRPSGTPAAGGP